MSIPKGLIIYKASRHQYNLPIDIKHGCYSDEMRSVISPGNSKYCKRFGRKYQQKLVQKTILVFSGKGQRALKALSVFSRFRSIKKCSLFVYDRSPKKNLTIRFFQAVFKTLKRLKGVEFNQLDARDQQNPKTFKPLTFLTNLETLTFTRFIYSQDPKNLEPLLHFLRLASKRRYLPQFRSLNFSQLSFQGLTLRRGNSLPALESLKSLLEFMKGLKSLENLQKFFNVRLALPYISPGLGCMKSLETLSEISREMVGSLTSAQITELALCSKILEAFQHSTNLKKVTFGIAQEAQEKVDLSPLNKIPSCQELELLVRNNKGIDLLSHSDILNQVRMFSNLTAFSIQINGEERPSEEFNMGLAGVISSLINLKSLKLSFGRDSVASDDERDFKPLNGAWLEDVFKAIGERTTLETLKLSIIHFSFENTRSLFGVLCESLKKLERLSDLSLDFADRRMTIEEKEMGKLCDCLSNLRRLEALDFSIVCSKFQSEVVSTLLSCFANEFPLLSTLVLSLENMKVTSQTCQEIENIAQKQTKLNSLYLHLIGQKEEGVDLALVQNNILKRTYVSILFVSRDVDG